MKFQRFFLIEFRRRIDGKLPKMCPLGNIASIVVSLQRFSRNTSARQHDLLSEKIVDIHSNLQQIGWKLAEHPYRLSKMLSICSGSYWYLSFRWKSLILKGTSTDIQKAVFWKVLFMWISMPIFSFIGYTLTELFWKSDNWQQIYKQTSSTFLYIKRCVEKKNN